MVRPTLESLGGYEMLLKISNDFYDRVYSHPWIGQYFKEIPQKVIETQQADFMNDALGGEKRYCGKFPVPAHKHIFITEELFDLRSKLLTEAFGACGAKSELVEAWIKIDQAFRDSLIKKSIHDCIPRFRDDPILDFQDPELRWKKAA